MSDIYLNPTTYDLDIINGEFRLCASLEELTPQKVYITLNMNKGNWKFNINQGVAWLANENNPIQLLGKKPKGVIDSAIKQAVLNTEGVIRIDEYSSYASPSDRVLNVDITFETEEGSITITQALQV